VGQAEEELLAGCQPVHYQVRSSRSLVFKSKQIIEDGNTGAEKIALG